MNVDLQADEIATLVAGLDCLKTKIAFTKGLAPAEKNAQIIQVEALEQKLRQAEAQA